MSTSSNRSLHRRRDCLQNRWVQTSGYHVYRQHNAHMVSTTEAYTAVILSTIINEDHWKCAFLQLEFSDKPPYVTLSSETPPTTRYRDQHEQGHLVINMKTLLMAHAEPIPKLVPTKLWFITRIATFNERLKYALAPQSHTTRRKHLSINSLRHHHYRKTR